MMCLQLLMYIYMHFTPENLMRNMVYLNIIFVFRYSAKLYLTMSKPQNVLLSDILKLIL